MLAELADRLQVTVEGSANVESQLASLKSALASKEDERNRVIGLFRRGRIDDAALDRQLDEIEGERRTLGEQIQQLEAEGDRTRRAEAELATARDFLNELNGRLDERLTWEVKRQLVEALVELLGRGSPVATLSPTHYSVPRCSPDHA